MTSLYSIMKPLLFCLPPEVAHTWALKGLRLARILKITDFFPESFTAPKQVMGLSFQNPVGLAAGFDKNGDYIEALATLGFGFIEVGTITKKPQPGNPKPRLFRLEKEQALINRMGFNNKGVEYLITRLKNTRYQGILGINIGKNRDTPLEHAVDEYVDLFRLLAPFAGYITLNVSSPNTQNLRQLQHGELLQHLLRALKKEQSLQNKYVPLVVKISPDVTPEELKNMAAIFLEEKIEGIIATNTTLNREGLQQSSFTQEAGGLSGRPLARYSNAAIKMLHEILQGKIAIMGSGGVMTPKDAQEKFQLGAELVQIYTGLIYQGPGLISGIGRIIV